jgi:hypothetical protein
MNEKGIVYEGEEYRLVNKKADVGEMVFVISEGSHDFHRGDVTVIKEVDETNIEQTRRADAECGWLFDSEYLVLEPLESESTPDIQDLLANLARRVEYLERKATSLEQQLRDTQGNCEKLAEELATVKHQTQPKEVEVVTFEKFLDSIADKVAERLVGDCRKAGGGR